MKNQIKISIKKLFQLSYLAILVSVLNIYQANAQVPQKFNYQGIARDVKGNPLSQQTLSLKLTVLPTEDASEAEYEETQTVSTNEFGLYTLQIGNGIPTNSFTTLGMKNVKWETGNKYIRVAIDTKGGTDYQTIGTTQLLSVPYAIYADKAGIARESIGSTGYTRAGSVSTAAAGTGTANYVTKFTAANTIYNSQLFDNGTNVGLGTTSPAAKLHIVGPSIADMRITSNGAGVNDYASMQLFNNAGTSFGFTKLGAGQTGNYTPGIPRPHLALFANRGSMLYNATGNIAFANLVGASNVTRMFIDSASGNVGINNSTPATTMDINSSETSGSTSDGAVNIGNSAGFHLTLDNNEVQSKNGINGFRTLYLNDFGGDISLANSMHIEASTNNIGIGTGNTPAAKLHVKKGSSGATPSTSATIAMENNGTNYLNILTPTSSEGGVIFTLPGQTNSGGMIYNTPLLKKSLLFGTDGNFLRMTIDSNGNVGVGTQLANIPKKFSVAGSTHTTGGIYMGSVEYLADSGGYTIATNSSLVPSTNSGANLGSSSKRWSNLYLVNSPSVSSDKRLKDNVANLNYGLTTLLKLRPVSYNLNIGDDKGLRLGLIAQELQKEIPEIVNNKEYTRDENNQLIIKDTEYLTVRYEELIPVLIKSVQEQQAMIKSLEERLSNLEKK